MCFHGGGTGFVPEFLVRKGRSLSARDSGNDIAILINLNLDNHFTFFGPQRLGFWQRSYNTAESDPCYCPYGI